MATMEITRIAELLVPFLNGPAPAQLLDQVQTYLALLVRWNRRLALTAVRNEEHIVTRHFGESLFAGRQWLAEVTPDVPRGTPGQEAQPPSQPQVAPASSPAGCGGTRTLGSAPMGGAGLQACANRAHSGALAPEVTPDVPRGTFSVTDIGSGAGFPGLPLKLYAPSIHLRLVEAHGKKATFLREVVRTLALKDVTVVNHRAEEPLNEPAPSDLVTLRAVEHFESILPVAARLVAPGGRLGLLIGASQANTAVPLLPGWSWRDPVPIPLSSERIVLTGIVPAGN